MPDHPPQSNPNLNPKEPFRPKYHFSVPQNWLNDPNGLVYFQGEYHLFYQYYPDDIIWGPMHWGHAVSHDLINWEHLPIALYPDELGMIFSGSAVIDFNNTAGFGPEAMVAVFTQHNPETLLQTQSLAYSLDCGRTFTKYPGNPVLIPQSEMTDFRDPKVFWFDSGDGSGHWVMCLAVGTAVHFYTSPNLIDWKMSGRFGGGYGSIAGVWETPEFFKTPVINGEKSYWVLSVGLLEGGPGGGSGTQYFVGNFDGQNFVAHYEKETVLWADHGADFYAVQSWNSAPDGRRIWLAWMNNWLYGKMTPATTWRGIFTIPREVGLVETSNGPRLVQKPVRELETLRVFSRKQQNIVIEPDKPFIPAIKGSSLEIKVDFELPVTNETEVFGARVRVGDGEYTAVGYWTSRGLVYLDRFNSGNVAFHEKFPQENFAPLEIENELIQLHMFVDSCSIEVFWNNGLVSFSKLIFPGENSLGVELFSEGGPVTIKDLVVYELKIKQVIE